MLLVLAGCRTPAVGGPSARPPSHFRIIADRECPEQYPPAPAWALSPDAPKPSAVDLTGAWTPVDAHAASGPVVRGPVCYEGLRFVTLIQKDGVVEAVWVFREPARGARVQRWARQAEAEVGRVIGASLHLEGALLNERGHVESEKTERTCRPVVIDLTYDGASGHLVGTRDGSPLRLAPLVFKTAESQTNPCGAPPPDVARVECTLLRQPSEPPNRRVLSAHRYTWRNVGRACRGCGAESVLVEVDVP